MNVQLINQRTNHDCVLACIAMWTQLPIDVIYRAAKKHNVDWEGKGVTNTDEFQLLKYFGKIPFNIDMAYGGVTGILSFPSLNVAGGSHALFYHKDKIYDPQFGNKDKKYYEQEINGFWPSCYNITIDLADNYSREIAEMWLNDKNYVFKNAISTIEGLGKELKWLK